MSKRTRYADNSKRRQPVQQQRLESARLALLQSKAAKRSEPSSQERERSGDKGKGER